MWSILNLLIKTDQKTRIPNVFFFYHWRQKALQLSFVLLTSPGNFVISFWPVGELDTWVLRGTTLYADLVKAQDSAQLSLQFMVIEILNLNAIHIVNKNIYGGCNSIFYYRKSLKSYTDNRIVWLWGYSLHVHGNLVSRKNIKSTGIQNLVHFFLGMLSLQRWVRFSKY